MGSSDFPLPSYSCTVCTTSKCCGQFLTKVWTENGLTFVRFARGVADLVSQLLVRALRQRVPFEH